VPGVDPTDHGVDEVELDRTTHPAADELTDGDVGGGVKRLAGQDEVEGGPGGGLRGEHP